MVDSIFKHPKFKKAEILAKSISWKENNPCASYGFWHDKKDYLDNSYMSVGCHAYFSTDTVACSNLVVTGFLHNPAHEDIFNRFKDWIFGSTSPWRIIVQNNDIVFLKDSKGVITSVAFGEDVIQSVDPCFLKNFAIALRFPGERHQHLVVWDKLVNKYHLDPRDAFLLSWSMRIKDPLERDGAIISGKFIDGAHCPLTNPISYRNYYDGNISTNINSYKVNGFFSGKDRIPDLDLGNSKCWTREVIQTKFGSTSQYVAKEEALVESFLEWKKDK